MSLYLLLLPNLQCYVNITALAFDVVGIERFGIPASEDAAFATLVATVQAFPGFQDIGPPLFFGGVVNIRCLHGFFK